MIQAQAQQPRSIAEPPRRWRARCDVPEISTVSAIARELSLPDTVSSLLVARGIANSAAARAFLRPQLDALHDAFALPDMDRAVGRVRAALDTGETILVHGDYDVDGVCSTTLLTRVLRSLGGQVVPFVPARIRDGYDLGSAGVDAARAAGARLILTADCGTGAVDAVAHARTLGIDVVVTDHHRPPPQLPAAIAVVNPARADSLYPQRALCGAGVAFKLCQALWAEAGRPVDELLWHLDLVAFATVADLMPLTGENRLIVHFGVRVLRRSPNAGLRALMRVAEVEADTVDAGRIAHVLAPRVNAAGRIGDANVAVRMLLTDSDDEAESLARELETQNRARRELDRSALDEALELLLRDYDAERDVGVVLAAEGWHPGVIGIVASRVVERICRPTLLVALNGSQPARGSGRSIRGFDLHEALRSCAPLLERFGGHRAAAGFDVRPERLGELRKAFNAHATARIQREDLVDDVAVDAPLPLTAATAELARLLAYLGPFGVGNPTPTFLARRVSAADARVVGQGHLRLTLRQDDAVLPAIGFGMAQRVTGGGLLDGPLDVVFRLERDDWRGAERVQARLVDLRAAR